jgi:hypothetical protein
MIKFKTAVCWAAFLILVGCGDNSAPPQYIKFAGGGLVFNYRVAQASMIVIAQQVTPFPEGATVEAVFDLPGTATRQSVKLPAMEGKLTYKLQSDPLTHITKGGRYNVTLRLLDKTGKELDHADRIFESDQDQSTLPAKPEVDPITLQPLDSKP